MERLSAAEEAWIPVPWQKSLGTRTEVRIRFG
jgi:hypothetical protein